MPMEFGLKTAPPLPHKIRLPTIQKDKTTTESTTTRVTSTASTSTTLPTTLTTTTEKNYYSDNYSNYVFYDNFIKTTDAMDNSTFDGWN